MLDRIEIEKSMIPYSFDITLADEIFTIEINYNAFADLFTLSLKKDGETICAGEPIIYGVPLFSDVFICGKFPALDIVPLDESREMTTITFENFGETVFLTIDNTGDEE